MTSNTDRQAYLGKDIGTTELYRQLVAQYHMRNGNLPESLETKVEISKLEIKLEEAT
ncbi:MAG: hypothetical protein V1839_00995 [archaeon]